MNLIRLLLAATGLAVARAFTPTASISNRATTTTTTTTNRPPRRSSSLHMVQGQGDSYKKVFVAGGSKGVGRLVVDKLLAAGSDVVVLVRSEDAVAELSVLGGGRVTAIRGDAMDYKTVEGAMDGCDAAITTLGGGQDDRSEGKWVDYAGNNNVI